MEIINSITNKEWHIITNSCIATSEKLLDVIAYNKNIKDINEFTNNKIKYNLPNPSDLLDMHQAVVKICSVITSKQSKCITIFGDYDVDGVTSVALLIRFLKAMNCKYNYVIPNRFSEGYGLNIDNIKKYKNDLIIAVDCGSNSFAELQYAKEQGIDIIVVDHHTMEKIPSAYAIINPHRPDELGKYKDLCAAGLVFLLLVAINRHLKCINFYDDLCNISAQNLLCYLDFVALGTVCDVMSLSNINRSLVVTGLKAINGKSNIGISSLISVIKKNQNNHEIINSEDVAFFIGPRINAAGRMADASLAVELLTCNDEKHAIELAVKLDELNKSRQKIESIMYEEALQQITNNDNYICVYKDNWHLGIIGVIAGKLKTNFFKPTIVISKDQNGIGRASCRSIQSVDISKIIQNAKNNGIIISGGGHAAAGGFSIDISNIDRLQHFLKKNIKYKQCAQVLTADCFLNIKNISLEMIEKINTFEPFGNGNSKPYFVIKNLFIEKYNVVAEKHMQIIFTDDNGCKLRSISFNCVNTIIAETIIHDNHHKKFSIIGNLIINAWKGQNYINFQLEDIAFCENK